MTILLSFLSTELAYSGGGVVTYLPALHFIVALYTHTHTHTHTHRGFNGGEVKEGRVW